MSRERGVSMACVSAVILLVSAACATVDTDDDPRLFDTSGDTGADADPV